MSAVWVKNLLKLQELDLEIRNLKLRLTMIPKEAENLKQEIAKIEGKVKIAKDKKAAHELQLKQNEAEIADLNDKIGKLQTQSALVKKNTEYQAMLGSIAMLKKSISDLESKQLELMDMLTADDCPDANDSIVAFNDDISFCKRNIMLKRNSRSLS